MAYRTLAPLCLVAALLAAPAARAEKVPQNAIYLLPVAHELGMYGLEWEHAFGPTSFYFAPMLRNPLGAEPLTLGLDLGLRFFPFSPAPKGFFIGPQLGFGYVHGARAGGLGVTPGANVGALLGFTLLIGDVFALSVAVGGEYYRDYLYENGTLTQDAEGLGTVLRGAVGFAF